ncbi:hypothetical protein B5F40_04070 [Gordonibacter sp. An230]|nr:hypothetical protein B5F40_04070 [Gordonibacter sp. An230]
MHRTEFGSEEREADAKRDPRAALTAESASTIRKHRKKRAEAANRGKTSWRTIAKWQNGRTTAPTELREHAVQGAFCDPANQNARTSFACAKMMLVADEERNPLSSESASTDQASCEISAVGDARIYWTAHRFPCAN